jgi:cellulose biosynthesis protein BcsQ
VDTIQKWLFDLFAKAHPAVQGGILFILLLAFGWLLYRYVRKQHQARELRVKLRENELVVRDLETRMKGLTERCESQKAEIESLTEERGRVLEQRDSAKEACAKAVEEFDRCREDLDALEKRFDDLQRIDTDVWLGPVAGDSPPAPFVSRHERGTRFVCFLNLKGGVGKTTLTVNLAAAYATGVAGETLRVLAVDLDYQATLSQMCVNREFLADRRKNRNTSRCLLEDGNAKPSCEQVLSPLLTPLEGTDSRGRVIVADEDLDRIDFKQQARFAVQQQEVRFHHRRTFHDPYVFQRFDLVFFDCPPRLSSSSVNALAASDFIVVPTSLHPNDVEAVPRTLQWWEKLHAIDGFHAKLAGVVLNRTYRGGTTDALTKDEKRLLELLENRVQRYEPIGGAVLTHVVGNSPDVARYAAGSVPMGAHEPGRQFYKDAALELLQRIRG